MTTWKICLTSALLTVAAASHAARPTSIEFEASARTGEGTPYAQYTVSCSNGKKVELTAWDNRRKWCVGGLSSGDCERRQLTAAKNACQPG